MLTELDECRKLDNLLILATSNFASSLDAAFLSRVDMHINVGALSEQAIYSIIGDILAELERVGIVHYSECELRICELCHRLTLEGINGRALRRLPFQVLSCYGVAVSASISRSDFIEMALLLTTSSQVCLKVAERSP